MEHMSFAKGITWIDDCRIPFVDETLNGGGYGGKNMGTAVYALSDGRKTLPTNKLKKEDFVEPSGRFPANILVCDDMLNDGVITKQNPRKYKADMDIKETSLLGFGDTKDKIQQGDKGTNSRYYNIDKWFDNLLESCG